MAESFGDDLGVNTSFEGQRCVGVAEIVQANLWEFRFGHPLAEQFGELVGVDRTADLVKT